MVPFIPTVPKVLHKLHTCTVTAVLGRLEAGWTLTGLGKMLQMNSNSFVKILWCCPAPALGSAG